MLCAQSQLLLRNQSLFGVGKWALVNPGDTQIFSELETEASLPNAPTLFGLHQYYDTYKALASSSPNTHFFSAAFDQSQTGELDGIVIYMPKAKQHLDMLIANMAQLLKPDGLLLVVGENKGGIKSVAKQLERFCFNINKTDSAKHCGLISGQVSAEKTNGHNFDIDKYAVTRSYEINQQSIKVLSLPGVFGHKQLDPGTALLLQQFADHKQVKQMRGQFYDFACGTGVIACYFLSLSERLKATLSDISALALYCAERSLALNGLQGKVVASDGMQEINGSFDHILSNPPFHEGLKNDYGITLNFIKTAHAKANRGCKLTIVANRFLPYPEHIQNTFHSFSVLCKTNKFSVYQGSK